MTQPRPRRRQDHAPHGLPLGGAERQGGLAQPVRHQAQHDLGGGADHRDHADAQGERGGEAAAVLAELEDQHGVDEEAGHDGRDGAHGLHHGPHHAGQATAHLAEIDRGRDGERHAEHHRDGDLLEGAHHGGDDAALVERRLGADVRRRLRVEVPVRQRLLAADEREDHDAHEAGDHDDARRGDQGTDQAVGDADPVERGGAHRGEQHQERGVPAEPEADHPGHRDQSFVDHPVQSERAQGRADHVGDQLGVGPADAHPAGGTAYLLRVAVGGRAVGSQESRHQISVAAPERDRPTTTPAKVLMTRVNRKSTSPAPSRPDSASPLDSE